MLMNSISLYLFIILIKKIIFPVLYIVNYDLGYYVGVILRPFVTLKLKCY